MSGKILLRTRTRSTYFNSIITQAKNTQKLKKSAINNLDKFCNVQYFTKDSEGIILELQKNNNIDQTLDVLQSWINWNADKRQPNGLRIYFSMISDYLYYRGIKLDRRDVRTLKFPKNNKRRDYALTLEEIQKIITPAKNKKKRLYIALISSGMRINESLRVQRKHFDLECERIKITIPAKFTKAGQERITFLSKEASKYNLKYIRDLEPDDLVWGKNPNWNNGVVAEDQNFGRLCDSAGLGMRYESNIRKITLHSFRAYFITKGNKIDDLGFGHAISGHDKYMKNYERYTDEELLELYLKLEPMLFVFDSTIQKEENNNLKEQLRKENEKLQNKINQIENKSKTDNDELEKRIRMLEKSNPTQL